MSGHPGEGMLQEVVDREAPARTRIGVWLHLRGCAHCRRRMDELRARSAAIDALIGHLGPQVDLSDAWERLAVRTGGRSTRGARARPWSAVLTGALLVWLVSVWTSPRATPPDGDLLAMVRTARAQPGGDVLRDRCCQDYDGGDLADDGLLTLSHPGERVSMVVVYEDVDRSGTFTLGDIVRHASRQLPRRD